MSVAKLEERSEATWKNISKFYFWRKPALRSFWFASLSHF
jgi:hypothetical protein